MAVPTTNLFSDKWSPQTSSSSRYKTNCSNNAPSRNSNRTKFISAKNSAQVPVRAILCMWTPAKARWWTSSPSRSSPPTSRNLSQALLSLASTTTNRTSLTAVFIMNSSAKNAAILATTEITTTRSFYWKPQLRISFKTLMSVPVTWCNPASTSPNARSLI